MPTEDAPIQLVDHDSSWERLFREERDSLRLAIGLWLKGPIEHIGSTAVPGLVAKPVIDIMGAVDTLENSKEAIAVLQSLNYQYAPYRADVEHWFCKPGPSFRTHHLHLVPFGSQTWIAAIKFRERLRLEPLIAAEYSELKIRLCALFKHDREAYTEGKARFIDRIVGKALTG